MATTTLVLVRKQEKHDAPAKTEETKRDETAEELLSKTDALLDEIEEILEVEPPQPKTLADLIRWGATMNEQAIGTWQGVQGETCALQAAFTAAKAGGLL